MTGVRDPQLGTLRAQTSWSIAKARRYFIIKIRIISFGNRNNTASWGDFDYFGRKIERNCEGR